MSIKIYYGSRIEELKKKLVENFGTMQDPFETREIVVPNGNLAKWLKLEIARTKGVMMGCEFPFLDKFLFETMISAIPNFDRQPIGLINEKILTLAIGKILAENVAEKAFAPFYTYCGISQVGKTDICADLAKVDVARKFWQLAGTLSRYILEYDCRRTADMDAWAGELAPTDARWKYVRLTDKKCDGSSIGLTDYNKEAKPLPESDSKLVDAQRTLFRKLFAAEGIYPSPDKRTANSGDTPFYSLRQIFNQFKQPADSACLSCRKGSQKIVLFGVSTIAPLQAEIIYQLAKKGAEIELYYLTVCTELWDDIETNREKQWRHAREAAGWKKVAQAQLKTDEAGSFEKLDFGSVDGETYENPILSALGTAGRETMRLFIEMESADIPVEMELCGNGGAEKNSMLGKVQYGICHRISGVAEAEQNLDDSIQVVRAPGANREVEMVYNAILGDYLRAKEKASGFSFSDIAVLVPDMKKYRPFFKQVFGARGQIPYGLIDPTASADSFYAAGLCALLELEAQTFTRSGVLAVLSNPCVQKARHILNEDFAHWVELVDRLGIHRGFSDEASEGSAAACSGSFAFTWNYALKRLRLGKMISSEPTNRYLGLPYGDIDSENCGESLSVNVEELYDAITTLRSEEFRTIAGWCTVIEKLAQDWLAVPAERREEVVMERSVGRLLDELRSVFAREKRVYPLGFVLGYVRQGLGAIPAFENGQYLTQGVTIASLSTMRLVPFQVVYVLGLGETEFPGVPSRSRLNLKQCRACLGDATIDNVNRHFFLEMLMSVRKRLVLSYDGEDTAKDERKYPSSVIRLIEDYLERYVATKFKEIELPLLERDLSAVGVETAGTLSDLEKEVITTYSNIQRQQARWDIARLHAVKQCEKTSETENSDERVKPAEVGGKEVEIPLKWLAEFLKEPRKAILKRRLKIYESSHADIRRADEEPIDPDSYRFYAAQDRLLLKMFQRSFTDEAVVAEYQKLQRSSQVGGGLLGEFSFQRSLKADMAAIAANQCFMDFVGKHSLTESHRPLRVRYPFTLDNGQKVVLTGEALFYWIDSTQSQLTLMTKRSNAEKNFIKNTIEQILFCAAVAAGGELSCGDNSNKNTLKQFEIHCFDDKNAAMRSPCFEADAKWLPKVVEVFTQEGDCAFLPIGLETVKKAFDDAKKEGKEDAESLDCEKLLESADSNFYGDFGSDDRVSPVKNMVEALAEECDRSRLLEVMGKMTPLYLALFKAVPKPKEEGSKKDKGQKKAEVK